MHTKKIIPSLTVPKCNVASMHISNKWESHTQTIVPSFIFFIHIEFIFRMRIKKLVQCYIISFSGQFCKLAMQTNSLRVHSISEIWVINGLLVVQIHFFKHSNLYLCWCQSNLNIYLSNLQEMHQLLKHRSFILARDRDMIHFRAVNLTRWTFEIALQLPQCLGYRFHLVIRI